MPAVNSGSRFCFSFCFFGFNSPLNSDMDYRVSNVCTDVDVRDCTWGCMDTIKESALKVDYGRKIPCCTGESNLRRWSNALSTELHPHLILRDFSLCNLNPSNM